MSIYLWIGNNDVLIRNMEGKNLNIRASECRYYVMMTFWFERSIAFPLMACN